MAREKKKEKLTPEERLREALIPEKEQPYKVPQNWCWTTLKYISSRISDGSHNPPKNSEKGIPLLSATNIHDHIIDIDNAARWITEEQWLSENQRTQIEPNDILLTIVASIGRTAVVKNERFALQRSVAVIKPKINSEFLSYYFETPYIQKFMLDNAKGTAQKGFYLKSLARLFCCVPPLAEQQRIVECLETLFAKLDEAKQKTQDVLDGFKVIKTATLHKAFTGELTAKWRKKHNVKIESWENKEISEIAKKIKAGGDKPDDFTEEADEAHNIPVVANGVVNEGIIGYTATARFSGETVTVAGRGTIGFSVYRTYPFFPIVRLIVIEPKDTAKAAYIKYAFDAFPESGTGSSIPQLTVPMVKEKVIPLPGLNEQAEIVRILDGMFAKEQQIKETVEAVLEQIDLIKKSILAHAFRGELATNDPREESSVELLKQSFSETINNEEVTPKQVIKSKAKEIFMPKTITEALLKGVRLTPEQLKNETKLSIDDFYAQLKELIDNGKIVENRENGESYLEVANENRQIENQQF